MYSMQETCELSAPGGYCFFYRRPSSIPSALLVAHLAQTALGAPEMSSVPLLSASRLERPSMARPSSSSVHSSGSVAIERPRLGLALQSSPSRASLLRLRNSSSSSASEGEGEGEGEADGGPFAGESEVNKPTQAQAQAQAQTHDVGSSTPSSPSTTGETRVEATTEGLPPASPASSASLPSSGSRSAPRRWPSLRRRLILGKRPTSKRVNRKSRMRTRSCVTCSMVEFHASLIALARSLLCSFAALHLRSFAPSDLNNSLPAPVPAFASCTIRTYPPSLL